MSLSETFLKADIKLFKGINLWKTWRTSLLNSVIKLESSVSDQLLCFEQLGVEDRPAAIDLVDKVGIYVLTFFSFI